MGKGKGGIIAELFSSINNLIVDSSVYANAALITIGKGLKHNIQFLRIVLFALTNSATLVISYLNIAYFEMLQIGVNYTF